MTAKFSANLGFLWADRPLPEAVKAAAAAGFDAVECHWPYSTDAGELKQVLDETGLPLLGINTVRGDVAAGEFGLSALPGRIGAARAAIDQAIEYAEVCGARSVHVMSGVAELDERCRDTLIVNLEYAVQQSNNDSPGFLIEPINQRSIPDYFLTTLAQAREIIEAVNSPRVRLMFDCFHTQITEGDLTENIRANLDIIGHIQIAGVPGRNEPDTGEIAYERLS